MANGRNVREVGARIEALLEELRAVADGPTREKAEELVRSLVQLYGAGLERVAEVLTEAGPTGFELLLQLADDPFVSSLLVLHGLHPVDADTRIRQALDQVRPYLGSHAGGVDYLGLDDEGVVHLRLEGSCHGCPSSTVTVKLAIERAVEEAAPEVVRVDVEGMTEEPPSPLLQIQPLRRRDGESTADDDGWTRLESRAALLPGETMVAAVEGVDVLLASAGGSMYAYRNACGACGSGLEAAPLEDERLTCPACGQPFDVRAAGRGLDRRDVHLSPLPLLQDERGWKVAVPQPVGA